MAPGKPLVVWGVRPVWGDRPVGINTCAKVLPKGQRPTTEKLVSKKRDTRT